MVSQGQCCKAEMKSSAGASQGAGPTNLGEGVEKFIHPDEMQQDCALLPAGAQPGAAGLSWVWVEQQSQCSHSLLTVLPRVGKLLEIPRKCLSSPAA